MRVALKKQFLDQLSSVLCHHRVLAFIYLGIPNRRLEQIQNQKVVQAPLLPGSKILDEEIIACRRLLMLILRNGNELLSLAVDSE